MALQGIDIAWGRPTTGQILATGARWVARYFSNDNTKNLHASEVHDYPAAGLSIVTVWETTTGRAEAGFAAGQTDARAADQQRTSVGLPAGMPIHFAVDTDTTWASVQAYFEGVASILGKGRVGVYGGFAVIEGAAAAGYPYLWQTTAWSAGRWSAHATIRQTGGTALQGQADVDQAVAADFGQYPRPTTQEDDMPYTPEQLVQFAQQGAAAAIQAERGTAVADNLWWWQHAIAGSVPAGASPAAAAAIQAIHSAVQTLETEPQPPKPAAGQAVAAPAVG